MEDSSMPIGRPSERIEKIFNVLSTKPQSLTNLAKLTNMHYRTVKEYIEMIIDVQNRPRLEKIESARTVLVRIRED